MVDSSIDLLALNREILLNPKAAGSNDLVALLELEKPGLEFLCPMARAIYWMENNRQDCLDVNEVLSSLWLIDDSVARGTGLHGDDIADVIETANHSITTWLDGNEIKLGFQSSTEMLYCTGFLSEHLRACRVQDIILDLNDEHFRWIEQWLDDRNFRSERDSKKAPWGHPSDDGEFIGYCRYKLTSVNGLSVDGPTFSDTYHEQEWEGLNEDYPQRWDREEENSSFCWLHYLSLEQAEQIGLAANGKQGLGPNQHYPEWVPTTQEWDEQLWIHSDRIQESYAKGSVVYAPSSEAWIAVGCGSKWDPTDPDDGLDPEDHNDWDEFPETMGPLLKIKVSRDAEQPPAELEALLPYWRQLKRMQYS